MSIRQFITRFRSKPLYIQALAGAAVFAVSAASFFSILFLLVAAGMFGKLPGTEELAMVENPLASEIYSADSVLIGKYFIQERSNVRFENLPDHLVNALIATEDARFYKHDGIDVRSLGRVLVKGILLQSGSAGGGSTLTQQLAKNLYPRKNYRLLSLPINKFREMIIARRLERTLEKDEIIALYLNTVPFGDNTYGIESAAQRFYSTSSGQLTVEQAAVLIGMLKATHYYNPRRFEDRSRARRNVVLSQMVKYEMLDPDEYEKLKALPVGLKYRHVTHHAGLAPYFRELLRAELLTWCEEQNKVRDKPVNLYTSGLRIYTTLDSRLQEYAEAAMRSQMKIIQKRFEDTGDARYLLARNPGLAEEELRKSPHYRQLVNSGLPEDSIEIVMRQPVRMSVFTWDGEKEMMLSPLDSVSYYLKFLNAGLLAMDPANGAIRAWVGGIDHEFFQYDHVRENTRRQVGSTFKPIVYAAALEQGVRPCAYISAEKTVYSNMEGWSPENSDDQNYDRKYSMPGALAYSINTVSVKVLEKAGLNNTIKLARKMGIKSELSPVPSLALGTADISVMEMVTAYSCFVNMGMRPAAHYLTSITTSDGTVIEAFKTEEPQPAMSPATASLMLAMLQKVVDEGTGSGIRSRFGLTGDVAGKTGTTQSNTDGWFLGITPRLVVGSWVGADNPAIHFRSTSNGQGARTALPIVGKFLSLAAQDETLAPVTHARFNGITSSQRAQLNCDLYKEDRNLFRRLSGRKEKKRNFNEDKPGFLKRLFRQ